MEKTNNRDFRILIVDDVPKNIQVLAAILKQEGYNIGFATDGKTALEHSVTTPYDIILLDIMLPDTDGFEICRRLKKNPETKDIPVIFITARDSAKDKIKGFEQGAVDFITKPFDSVEVLARVRNHLALRSYALKLEMMVEERTSQLLHANRLIFLGTFASAIVHEIANPATFISGNATDLKQFWNAAGPIIAQHADEDETDTVDQTVEDVIPMLDGILDGTDRILNLLNRLRSYYKTGSVEKKNNALRTVVDDAIKFVSYKIRQVNLHIDKKITGNISLYCNHQELTQVFVNLISNTCDAVGNDGGQMVIKAFTENGKKVITVTDNGPGIAANFSETVFDPFSSAKSEDKGTGLGLYIVRTIVEDHGGKVFLSESESGGASFRIEFNG